MTVIFRLVPLISFKTSIILLLLSFWGIVFNTFNLLKYFPVMPNIEFYAFWAINSQNYNSNKGAMV